MNEFQVSQTPFNGKYKKLPGEFVYKGAMWCIWSNIEFIKRIESSFKFYPDDVLVATYPKSGTTVLQEICWQILNNVDIEKANKIKLYHRFPFIDEYFERDYPNLNKKGYIIDMAEDLERPRTLKTHLLFRNLRMQIESNPDMKVIVSLRNPRDTAVSMYHFYTALSDYGPFEGSWDDFFDRWYDGWISGGNWLDVTTEWWTERHRKNFKIVFYEDMICRKKEVIVDLCQFLGKQLTDDQVNAIVRHTSFESMKSNPATNYENMEGLDNFIFMRKGKIGDWKNWFSEYQIKKLDDKYNPVFEKMGLKFQYEA